MVLLGFFSPPSSKPEYFYPCSLLSPGTMRPCRSPLTPKTSAPHPDPSVPPFSLRAGPAAPDRALFVPEWLGRDSPLLSPSQSCPRHPKGESNLPFPQDPGWGGRLSSGMLPWFEKLPGCKFGRNKSQMRGQVAACSRKGRSRDAQWECSGINPAGCAARNPCPTLPSAAELINVAG